MEKQMLDKSSNANSQSHAPVSRAERLILTLTRFYSVVGHRPDEPGALALMAEYLANSATDEKINAALNRCAHECRYPIRLPDILTRISGQEIPEPDAEARKAFVTVLGFTDKYVQSDVQGNYVISQGVRRSPIPLLSPQIVDTVARTGGWKTYKTMTAQQFPFVQKRFVEEYLAWKAVSEIPSHRMLVTATTTRSLAASQKEEKKTPEANGS